jgi:hypothetical protein
MSAEKTLHEILFGEQDVLTIEPAARIRLSQLGYDGLYCSECGCELDDLMPCGGEGALDCYPAYKHEIKNGQCEHAEICDRGDICNSGLDTDSEYDTVFCGRKIEEAKTNEHRMAADRDRWKARAEAMERAMRSPEVNGPGNLHFAPCESCMNADTKSCRGGECMHLSFAGWQFDEARFTE